MSVCGVWKGDDIGWEECFNVEVSWEAAKKKRYSTDFELRHSRYEETLLTVWCRCSRWKLISLMLCDVIDGLRMFGCCSVGYAHCWLFCCCYELLLLLLLIMLWWWLWLSWLRYDSISSRYSCLLGYSIDAFDVDGWVRVGRLPDHHGWTIFC